MSKLFVNKRLSPLEKEKRGLFDDKNQADKEWDNLFMSLINKEKIEAKNISDAMEKCNKSDTNLLIRGYKI